jgi:hypothetical protein
MTRDCQVTQRDGTLYLAFKYDASEQMSLSVYWGLDTAAIASSVERWNMRHSTEAASKTAPSAIMSCLPMFARSYNQMRDEHIIEMSGSLGGGAASSDGAFNPSPLRPIT